MIRRTYSRFTNLEMVLWSYRILLGREPENLDALVNCPFRDSREELVKSMINSEEFISVRGRWDCEPEHVPFFQHDKPALCFIHVVKTGGTTFHSTLQNAYPAERTFKPELLRMMHFMTSVDFGRYDFFSGHFDYFTSTLIPRRKLQRVTILRDPRRRLLSAYRYARAHPPGGEFVNDRGIQLANELEPEDFFEHPDILAHHFFNNVYLFCYGTSYDDYETLERLVAQAQADIADTSGGVIQHDQDILQHVEEATRRIVAMEGIALTERLEECAPMVCSAIGIDPPDQIKHLMRTDELPEKSEHYSKVPPITMTPRLTRALDRLCHYDKLIYTSVSKEVTRRLRLFQQQQAEPSRN